MSRGRRDEEEGGDRLVWQGEGQRVQPLEMSRRAVDDCMPFNLSSNC